MAAKSTYLSNALLGHVFGKSTYTKPTHYYLCLTTVVPISSDTGSTITEVGYTNYVRLLKDTADFSAVSAQAISNTAAFTFATCGASGATARGWAVCDAASVGNMLWYGTLTDAVVIATGDAPKFDAAAFVIGES
jgi:hypothetical protein